MLFTVASWLASAGTLRAQIEPPRPDRTEAIEVSAPQATRWMQGTTEVWWLAGGVTLRQGATTARAADAVLWIKRSGDMGDRQTFVTAYFEGQAELEYTRAGFPYKLQDNSWFGEFFTSAPITMRTPQPNPEPPVKPLIFQRAQLRRDPLLAQSMHHTQFAPGTLPAAPLNPLTPYDQAAQLGPAPLPGTPGMLGLPAPGAAAPVEQVPPPVGRRLRVYPRGSTKVQASWFSMPERQEWVAVISSGVNLVMEGDPNVGTLDISADRMVLWTRGAEQPDLGGQTAQASGTPLELYMEGNVTFRQGDRVVYANRVYYDVQNQLGTLVEADLFAPAATLGGTIRLKSELLKQMGRNRFVANNTIVTTSQFAEPTYRIQAREIEFEDEQVPVVEPVTGQWLADPETGEPAMAHKQMVTSRDNTVFVGPVPIFYWPRFASDLEDPSMFIQQLTYRQDRIFGSQFLTRFNMYQLLGIKNKPQGTAWSLSTDYLSYRGPAAGTNFNWRRDDIFGFRGPARGYVDAWGLPDDKGTDILGSDRMNLLPERTDRGRIEARHRQELADGWRITAETWLISDPNFLEQYFERDWDTGKDFTTGVELKRLLDNQSFSVVADLRPNNFLTQTESLPRGDHFWLGQPLLADRLTYFEHTTAGYERLQVGYPGLNPVDQLKSQPLSWMVPSQGVRFITGHEVDAPVDLGPVKFVPYAMGQYGHWGQDLSGGALDRLYGQAGVRASVPFWRVDPTIESTLFNVHGLAHKVVLDADLYAADASQHINQFPLYDPLDDDTQEMFRERMRFNTFGGAIPAGFDAPVQFDERYYALRSGLASSVTSPSLEIADRLAAARLGARQRLQTKRGPIERRRIIDWMVLDTEATLFPNPNRDNFGQVLGLVNYDYRWHVGDRLTVLSAGQFDFFAQGQNIMTFGATLNRPPRGQIYAGFYAINGPIHSDVFSTFYSYRLSPKWLTSLGISYDMAGNGLIGNQLSLTRIGEAFLTNFNFVVDPYKNNVAFNFMVQPRLGFGLRTPMMSGPAMPAAGATGLE